MTIEILGSVTYAETPTVNGTEVLLNGSNPTTANITFGNVIASGTLTATNLTGTNTGDQTITLTGAVTGSGTGSFATTLSSVGTAGTYTTVTTDATGRVTSGATTQAWSTITATPTTLAGYGITDGGGAGVSVVKAIYTGSTAGMTGTSLIPANTAVPLITGGTQLWTQTVTPASTASKFIISQTFNLDSGTANRSITAAVFRGSTCVAATSINIATSGRAQALAVMAVDAPATASAITYSLRMGVSTSATWYLNQGAVGAVTYGGTVNHSDWTIMEI